ncbi:small acid-soluble spore protein Tlp [Alicyclobacillus tolerans]|uniref:Small acid-soluble spore protein (Thioredoxin-like protein) n=2 Tax=Alicyclobacillus tolerans TaxID=90970 RepID=A0A1M6JRA3_9BACL|nr:small acid-soluble spore protein Tlp [Alicyclobacillus tengchongensis]MDP9727425.1 small acid-soluble spore protein (thioredoxin-like protein) [Alicyclobacillus tengchongensis]SHJ49143.1 small acid-soluble spore protein (thioredoxin-like protein) [Alicyclobacillus montanus]
MTHPHPDNRSDNVLHLQKAIRNTQENMREAEDFLKAHEEEMHTEDIKDIQAKNDRRQRAIHGMREEIKDEIAHSKE